MSPFWRRLSDDELRLKVIKEQISEIRWAWLKGWRGPELGRAEAKLKRRELEREAAALQAKLNRGGIEPPQRFVDFTLETLRGTARVFFTEDEAVSVGLALPKGTYKVTIEKDENWSVQHQTIKLRKDGSADRIDFQAAGLGPIERGRIIITRIDHPRQPQDTVPLW
jgi:hypothetical protein